MGQITTMQGFVKKVLLKYPETRDDDRLLVTKIWQFMLVEMDIKPSLNNISTFFQLYIGEKLPSADIITRARRKCQEEDADLRGATWNERHKEAENVREEMRG